MKRKHWIISSENKIEKKKREQTNNCLGWQQKEHFKVLTSEASRDSRFGWLFLLGHMLVLWQWQAKGGHGNAGEGSDPLKARTLSSRRHPRHPGPTTCNSLLHPWPFLLVLLPTPTHGYQSHKLCEEEEELTVLNSAKIWGLRKFSASEWAALTILTKKFV